MFVPSRPDAGVLSAKGISFSLAFIFLLMHIIQNNNFQRKVFPVKYVSDIMACIAWLVFVPCSVNLRNNWRNPKGPVALRVRYNRGLLYIPPPPTNRGTFPCTLLQSKLSCLFKTPFKLPLIQTLCLHISCDFVSCFSFLGKGEIETFNDSLISVDFSAPAPRK